MKKILRHIRDDRSGEITIESMLVMIPTIFVLLFLISLGFLLYQHWNLQIAADDAVSKIAGTYAVTGADNRTGAADSKTYSAARQYRNIQLGFFGSQEHQVKATDQRLERYVKTRINTTSLARAVGEPLVEPELVVDGYARKHISLKVTASFRIPFSEWLELFGMNGVREYTVTSSADCSDMLDYLNAVNFAKVAPSYIDSKTMDMMTEWMKVIQSIRNFNKEEQPTT